ncbi:uncharacterized protein LOC141902494 [Tubulanus polymorphus]|uniref:uncharacterized protein LOC141902494 n=1 Tax=Tubulanus polymorphus TaxID=672921 RepID=UPI003DA58E72
MDFSFTGLSFGDFSGLTPEENQRVKTILLRPKEAQPPNGPEFPWSEEEFRLSFGVDRITEIAESFAGVRIQQSVVSHVTTATSGISQRDSPVVIDMECDIVSSATCSSSAAGQACSLAGREEACASSVRGMEVSSFSVGGEKACASSAGGELVWYNNEKPLELENKKPDASEYSLSGERRLSNDRKPYERRNKKKRPPGYYDAVYNNPTSETLVSDNGVTSKYCANVLINERGAISQSQCIIPNHTEFRTSPPDCVDIRTSPPDSVDIRTNNEKLFVENDHSFKTARGSDLGRIEGLDLSKPVGLYNYDKATVDKDIVVLQPDVGENNRAINNDNRINCDTTTRNIIGAVEDCDIDRTNGLTIEFLQDNDVANIDVNCIDIVNTDSSCPDVLNTDDCTTVLTVFPDAAAAAPAAAASPAVGEIVNISEDTASLRTNYTEESTNDVEYVNIEKPKSSSIASFSWASLFKKKDGASSRTTMTNLATSDIISNMSGDNDQKQPADFQNSDKQEENKNINEITATKQLGNLLLNLQLNHRPISLQPRGLSNRGNWCYVNATLQALLACPPFYHLIKSLPSYPALIKGPSSTPVIDSIVEFVNEFIAMKFPSYHSGSKGKKDNIRQDISCGPCFEPVYVYQMLQSKSDVFKHGKQEDAEEFLSYLLNGIHEEMLTAEKALSDKSAPKENQTEVANGYGSSAESADENEEDESWEQVGPKKKSMITRVAEFTPSAISAIFCGQMRSVLHQPGSRESATLQPFFTLQLDIQSERVMSVKDALEGLLTRESVQGYTCSKTKTEVEASRRMMLEVLPPVLILHLKYFIFNKDGGCQKLLKRIDYPVDLEINKDLLSPSTKSKLTQTQRSYKLFAAEYHHGRNAAGGHYTVDVYHPGIQGWVHIDDSMVHSIPLSQVLKPFTGRVPYLLYYRRCDLLTS